MNLAIELAERGWLPGCVIRRGIRQLCAQRLSELRGSPENASTALRRFIERMGRAPIAPQPGKPNQQHYELPAAFFEQVLGPRLKYSGCLYATPETTLAEAEEAMLALSCERADLQDGMTVLDLGCGWGALSLWIAQRYPNCRVTALSNSRVQKDSIERRAARDGLAHLEVLTCDINDFQPQRSYDCVMCIEMFEHMRNYWRLLQRISQWLRPEGTLFVHIFAHRDYAYEYATEGAANWMGRHFFTAGMMPADGLLPCFQDHLKAQAQWRVDGLHYQRTAQDWLQNLVDHRTAILPLLKQRYGADAGRWYQRWRMFFLACSEMFGYQRGTQWGVSHYRFVKPGGAAVSGSTYGQIVGRVEH